MWLWALHMHYLVMASQRPCETIMIIHILKISPVTTELLPNKNNPHLLFIIDIDIKLFTLLKKKR